MKNVKEMRAALIKKRGEGKAKVDAYNTLQAKAEGSELSDDERAKMSALDADIDALESDVAKLSADIEAEEKKARRTSAFASSTAIGNQSRIQVIRNEPDPVATGGFNSMAEFCKAVMHASMNTGFDERLNAAAPANIHQSGGNAGEGYLVPAEFRQEIWENIFGGYDLLSMFNPSPTASNMVNIIKDETTPWGAVGVQAAWRSEGNVMAASKVSLTGSSVPLHELFAFVGATDELLSDAPQLRNRITVKAADAIRFRASRAIHEGTGVGQPLGYMTSPALIVQAAEGGQTAGTINVQNIAKMMSRMPAAALARSVWLGTPEILPQLVNLTIGNVPVFTQPNAGIQDAPGGSILGRPLMYTEHNSPLGQQGDLCLVSPDGYFAVTKQGGGLDFASSIHLWFDQATTAFRWIFRIGGQPLLSAPISPNKGSLTKSHFVTLAAR